MFVRRVFGDSPNALENDEDRIQEILLRLLDSSAITALVFCIPGTREP